MIDLRHTGPKTKILIAEDMAREVKLPLFRIPLAAWELVAAGLLEPVGDNFRATNKGARPWKDR
jgi:hypothetical protein